MEWGFISGFIMGLVLFLAVLAVYYQKKRLEGKYYEQNWIGLGVALGLIIGLNFGIAMDNIAFGPGIGVAIGAGIGSALQAKYGRKKIKLTPKLRQRIWRLTLLASALLIIGVIVFALFAFSQA